MKGNTPKNIGDVLLDMIEELLNDPTTTPENKKRLEHMRESILQVQKVKETK